MFSFKKEGYSNTCYNVVNFGDIMPNEITQSQKDCTWDVHEVLVIVRVIETESIIVVAIG